MDSGNPFRAFVRRFWRRWSAPWATSWSEADMGERIVFTMFSTWILCVGVAVWTAMGQPPWWLAHPATAVLWALGVFFFLLAGLPVLALPFYGLWVAFRGTPQDDDGFREEYEKQFEERMKRAETLKTEGVLPEDVEMPAEDGFSRPRFLPEPKLPSLPIWTAGAILIVTLLVSERPVLASLYLIPVLAWLALEGFAWLLQAWRSR